MSKELRAMEEVNEMINSLEEYNKLMRFRKPPETATDIMLRKLDIVKQALLKAQEQEKVLEIIVDKGVDFSGILGNHKVEKYNSGGLRNPLTEEEFDLLKRWFDEHQNRK